MQITWYDRIAYIGLYLAILCLFSVIAFHFPEYLSNPELRASYNVDHLRIILFVSIYLSFACGLITLFLSHRKKIAFAAICITAIVSILGGATVEVQVPIEQKPIYLSLDLIIIDLLLMSVIFVPLERLFYLRRQRFLRPGLQTDLSHYTLNHILMGGVFFLIVLPGNWLRDHFFAESPLGWVQDLPIYSQVLMILFIADFAQYWIHRYFHKNKAWWQFHKIHHSTESMDWLASSRLHIADVIVTRAFSYVPIVCLGFSQQAILMYLPIVAIQALFVHANVRFTFGPLRYVITTPIVHHWHHSSDKNALDKNFAVTFSIIDLIFGTFYCPKKWPEKYGLYQERISNKFIKQLFYPFLKQIPFGKNAARHD